MPGNSSLMFGWSLTEVSVLGQSGLWTSLSAEQWCTVHSQLLKRIILKFYSSSVALLTICIS